MSQRPAKLVRFSLYGLIVGVAMGFGAGVWFATSDVFPGWVSSIPDEDFPIAAGAEDDPLSVFNTSGLIEPTSSIQHGGPRKDGIPALIDPHVVPLEAAGLLQPHDRIVGVSINDESRAYPIRLLNYHEIVNDTLGGTPIAVVYCPLCDSVSVLDRRVDGNVMTFGVSGQVLHSNVLMYDQKDDALWSQIGARAISGPFAGNELTHINTWEIARFAHWSERHPDGDVASFETGHKREYERSPYGDYLDNDSLYFPVPKDGRLRNRKERIIGILHKDEVLAIPITTVREADGGRLVIPFGDERLILISNPETQEIAIDQSPAGSRVMHTFWFAWAAFHPETSIFGREP